MKSIKKTNIASPYFPKEFAKTANYSLGAPKTFQVSQDGHRVFFLRSDSGTNRMLDLWMFDLEENDEIILVKFSELQVGRVVSVVDPIADRLRKERLREKASGITSYTIDKNGALVAFAVGGDVYLFNVETKSLTTKSFGDATDVKLAPDGQHLSFVMNRELFVSQIKKDEILTPRRVSPPATTTISWGLADFIAAEEMHRSQGHWWSPDSGSLIFEGVDVSDVKIWHISNLTDPAVQPHPTRYPQAGTNNALLSLYYWTTEGASQEITWDKERFPYLVNIRWKGNVPTVAVQDRPQKLVRLFDVDTRTQKTTVVYEKKDPRWVELIEGVPSWNSSGQVIDAPDAERRTLRVGGRVASAPRLELRKFIGMLSSGDLVYTAADDPRNVQVWVSSESENHRLLSPKEGVFGAEVGGNTVVIYGTRLGDRPHYAEIVNFSAGIQSQRSVRNLANRVRISPDPKFLVSRLRGINYAVLYPKNFSGQKRLPVLMDPYGGPWVQRCHHSSLSFTASQWFADQGFVVVVADGRGTPGRGRRWEKAVAGDLLHPVLQDQLAVLDDVIRRKIPIDVDRVAIRGWSFGGYLAAVAVLLAPERFKAAIAGAPVTDWRYYDTHYSERYLGDPTTNTKSYDMCSAIVSAPRLRRPLLLIHGLEDDNVFCAHSLRLSKALFETGKPHSFLPLIGVTHMAASETAAEGLLRTQLSFLRGALLINDGG